jgi:hypothetical protein
MDHKVDFFLRRKELFLDGPKQVDPFRWHGHLSHAIEIFSKVVGQVEDLSLIG